MQPSIVPQRSAAWADLGTVTTFDAGPTCPINSTTDKHVAIHDVQHLSPPVLLFESLLELLCKLLVKDPATEKTVFKAFCRILHQKKVIDRPYSVEEYENLRIEYQKAFLHYADIAISTVGSESKTLLHLHSPQLDLSSAAFHDALQWSRYSADYIELEYIAKGGFGQVYKVRHRLDGQEYAVKKILLRYRNLNNFLQNILEVKMLAKLHHPNIVSYKCAWLEPVYSVMPEAFVSHADSEGLTSEYQRKSETSAIEESSSIVFKDSCSEEKIEHSKTISSTSSSRKYTVDSRVYSDMKQQLRRTSFLSDTEANSLSSCREEDRECSVMKEANASQKAVCQFVVNDTDVNQQYNFRNDWATLFIQMQLCPCTLRRWLDERNVEMASEVNVQRCLSIFSSIVSGVAYIHSQGIVHHDIKPNNIFVNGREDHVQVGDFGLACFLQHYPDSITLMGSHGHRGEFGTPLYAAPEQLDGKCDTKSDIYSLGIVLLELLHPFHTDMERSKIISQVRKGSLPPDFVNRMPTLVPLIQELLSPEPEKRPSAGQLLKNVHVLLNEMLPENRRETLQQLLEELDRKEHEVEELRRKVQKLQASE